MIDSPSPTRETHSILFETSPYDNLDAIVEHDGRAVYFYLAGHHQEQRERFGMRACWVRNLKKGPHVFNVDDMEAGIAPMLPRHDCVDVNLHRLPAADDLKVVWLEEGNGAALLEKGASEDDWQVIAVIPPWSGIDGFHGYAANCANETKVCWPLPDNPMLKQRIEHADEFWQSWIRSQMPQGAAGDRSVARSPFAVFQPQILANYATRFPDMADLENDNAENYFSIDGGLFPPRGLIHRQTEQNHILATVGMSLCPQPAVEMFVDDPREFRRIELALLLPKMAGQDQAGDVDQARDVEQAMQQISGLTGYPWRYFTWLGAGHTCGFKVAGYEAALLVEDAVGSRLAGCQCPALPSFRYDPVKLLWLIPITSQQQADLQAGTTTADEVLQSWGR